jgi:hypothetical protein
MAEVERAKATAALHEEGADAASGETACIVRGVSHRKAALADEKVAVVAKAPVADVKAAGAET